jgi:hypothetical protein
VAQGLQVFHLSSGCNGDPHTLMGGSDEQLPLTCSVARVPLSSPLIDRPPTPPPRNKLPTLFSSRNKKKFNFFSMKTNDKTIESIGSLFGRRKNGKKVEEGGACYGQWAAVRAHAAHLSPDEHRLLLAAPEPRTGFSSFLSPSGGTCRGTCSVPDLQMWDLVWDLGLEVGLGGKKFAC